MLSLFKKLRLILLGLSSSVFLGILVAILFAKLPEAWNLTRNLDRFFLNLFHSPFYNSFFSPTVHPAENLVVIDRLDPVGHGARLEYAELVHQLDAAGASCIAIDVLFLGESKTDTLADRALVESLETCRNVILAVDFSQSDLLPSAEQLYDLSQLALPDSICARFMKQKGQLSEYPINGIGLPYTDLLRAAQQIGHINHVHNEYDRFPPIMQFRGKCYASLPLAIALQCSGMATNGNGIDGTAAKHFSTFLNIPLDGDQQMLAKFIEANEFQKFTWHEARELLNQHPETFLNKIVMIVNSVAEPPIPTPLGPYPRWAALASLTSQLLQESYIEPSPVFYPTVYSAAIIVMGLIWFLFFTPRLRPAWRRTRILFLFGNAIFFLIVVVLLRVGQTWIGVVVPLLMFNLSLVVVRKRYYTMIRPPHYTDFGIAILERRGKKYPVQVFLSEVGEDTTDLWFASFLEEEEFQQVLDRIRLWESSRDDMRWIGEKLFDALFQGEIHQLFERTLREAKHVRLKLKIDAPELICLPWELMRSDKLESEYLALHKRVSMVRHLSLHREHDKPAFRSPLKVLLFISSAGDLETDVERDLIKEALRPYTWSWDVKLRICSEASLENLSAEIDHEPDIIHYIGHSEFDNETNEAYLIFETTEGREQQVFSSTLRNLLVESAVKLVILNGCKTSTASESDAFTGMGQNLVKIGIPAVVAMQFKIPDPASIRFSEIFYRKLLGNFSIDAAVAEARRQIMVRTKLDRQDWATPVLFMRREDGILFDSES